MKLVFAAVASAAMIGGVFAAETLQIKGFADFKGGNKPSAYVKNIDNGIRITNKGRTVMLESVKQIPIDLKKKYQITCDYRLTPGSSAKGRFYFAPACYDKNGKQISAVSQYPIGASATSLAAAVKKGDTVVKIKNGAKWVLKWGYIVFGAKADYSDLPNFNMNAIKSITRNGNVWEIALQTPVAKDYPAGTAVREHRAGASYRYMLANIPEKSEWVKFSRVLSGAKFKGAANYNYAWRTGTAKVSVIIFTSGNVDVELRNISIKEVK